MLQILESKAFILFDTENMKGVGRIFSEWTRKSRLVFERGSTRTGFPRRMYTNAKLASSDLNLCTGQNKGAT